MILLEFFFGDQAMPLIATHPVRPAIKIAALKMATTSADTFFIHQAPPQDGLEQQRILLRCEKQAFRAVPIPNPSNFVCSSFRCIGAKITGNQIKRQVDPGRYTGRNPLLLMAGWYPRQNPLSTVPGARKISRSPKSVPGATQGSVLPAVVWMT